MEAAAAPAAVVAAGMAVSRSSSRDEFDIFSKNIDKLTQSGFKTLTGLTHEFPALGFVFPVRSVEEERLMKGNGKCTITVSPL